MKNVCQFPWRDADCHLITLIGRLLKNRDWTIGETKARPMMKLWFAVRKNLCLRLTEKEERRWIRGRDWLMPEIPKRACLQSLIKKAQTSNCTHNIHGWLTTMIPPCFHWLHLSFIMHSGLQPIAINHLFIIICKEQVLMMAIFQRNHFFAHSHNFTKQSNCTFKSL